MLCLSREIDQGIRIGGPLDLSKLLAPDELLALERCQDGTVGRAVTKLVAALETPAEVFFLENRGDRIRLGVIAPKWMPVDRNEIADAKAAGRVK